MKHHTIKKKNQRIYTKQSRNRHLNNYFKFGRTKQANSILSLKKKCFKLVQKNPAFSRRISMGMRIPIDSYIHAIYCSSLSVHIT